MDGWGLILGWVWAIGLTTLVICGKKKMEPRLGKRKQCLKKSKVLVNGKGEDLPTFNESLIIPSASVSKEKNRTLTEVESKARKGRVAAQSTPEHGLSTKTGSKAGKSEEKPTVGKESRTSELVSDQLSEYEGRKTKHATHTLPPPIPPASHREEEPGKEPRKPLVFLKQGKVKLVPMDQGDSWPTFKDRLVPNPERREHVLRTIRKIGGFVVDPSVPCQLDEQGEIIPGYKYVKPNS